MWAEGRPEVGTPGKDTRAEESLPLAEALFGPTARERANPEMELAVLISRWYRQARARLSEAQGGGEGPWNRPPRPKGQP